MICVSIRKDIDRGFKFPDPVPLTIKFRDLLEADVDESFFVNEGYYEFLVGDNEIQKQKRNGFKFSPVERESAEIAQSIVTQPDRRTGNYVREKMPSKRKTDESSL